MLRIRTHDVIIRYLRIRSGAHGTPGRGQINVSLSPLGACWERGHPWPLFFTLQLPFLHPMRTRYPRPARVGTKLAVSHFGQHRSMSARPSNQGGLGAQASCLPLGGSMESHPRLHRPHRPGSHIHAHRVARASVVCPCGNEADNQKV